MKQFKYFMVLFMSEGRVKHETDRWTVEAIPICCGEHKSKDIDLLSISP